MTHDKTERIWVPQVLSTIMLIIVFNPSNPYGYYILLRWVCCSSFVYLAVKAFEQERRNWTWVLGIMALIYNPLVQIHLNREIWTVINLVTIVFNIVSIASIKKMRKSQIDYKL